MIQDILIVLVYILLMNQAKSNAMMVAWGVSALVWLVIVGLKFVTNKYFK